MSQDVLVSVIIPCHNQAHFVLEAINSCLIQDYKNIEIIVLADACTDNTSDMIVNINKDNRNVWWIESKEPSGTGGSFNKLINVASGDIVILLCADDVFTDFRLFSDIVKTFKQSKGIVHVTRYYHQFIDGDRRPVRAWRCNDAIELANNPSGLAFRSSALKGCELSNKMFVEASCLVDAVRKKGQCVLLPWDTVAVRIHQSTARSKDYYKKRWVSSPVEEWSKVGGNSLQNDFTSLIQIKNYFVTSAVFKECWNFIRLRPLNLLNPAFWFFSLVSICTPRFLLMKIPHWYRKTWGRWTTREMRRP